MTKETDIYREANIERFADFIYELIEKYGTEIDLNVHINTANSG